MLSGLDIIQDSSPDCGFNSWARCSDFTLVTASSTLTRRVTQSWHAKLLLSKEKKALANDCIKRTVILNLKKNAEQRPLGCKKRGPQVLMEKEMSRKYIKW